MLLRSRDLPLGSARPTVAITATVGMTFTVHIANADPPDAPDDFGIVLADPTIDSPPVLP